MTATTTTIETLELYRANSQWAVLSSAMDRVKFLAENGGSLKAILSEISEAEETILAINGATTMDEIEEML